MLAFAHILNFTLMIFVPVLLGVFLSKRVRSGWRLFGIGMLTFVASQVLHIPFNNYLLVPALKKIGLFYPEQTWLLVVFSLIIGLSAGIFEECARYLVYRYWIKDARTWKEALMFGAGHGGVEAILLGVLAMIAFGFLSIAASNAFDLSGALPADKMAGFQSQLHMYWTLPWYTALMGALERLFALAFHLSASVIVLQAFRRRSLVWLGAAILWHAALDGTAVFLGSVTSVYVTEAVVGLFALVSIAIVFALRDDDVPLSMRLQPVQPDLSPGISSEKSAARLDAVEDSRYDG